MEMWFSEFHTPDVKHSIRVTQHLYAKKSKYQQIDIFETPEYGRVLTLDGNVQLTERDEFIYTTCKNNTFNGMPLPDIRVLRKSGETELIRSFGYQDFKMRLGR